MVISQLDSDTARITFQEFNIQLSIVPYGLEQMKWERAILILKSNPMIYTVAVLHCIIIRDLKSP